MMTMTTLSHLLILLLVYVCAVQALTDEDLEKILNDAVDSEEMKPIRRYPELDELGELKDRLEAIENLNSDENAAVFGSVNPSTDEDGIFDGLFGADGERVRGRDNPLNFINIDERPQEILRNNQLRDLNHDIDATRNENYILGAYPVRVRRDQTPSSEVASQSNGVTESKDGNPTGDKVDKFSSVIIDRLKKCLKDNECLQRHLHNSDSKEQGAEGFKVQTRNPFCNRRGCGRKRSVRQAAGRPYDLAGAWRDKTTRLAQPDKKNDGAFPGRLDNMRERLTGQGGRRTNKDYPYKHMKPSPWRKVKMHLSSPFDLCGINPRRCQSLIAGQTSTF